MLEERSRFRCIDEDGDYIDVVETQHFHISQEAGKRRKRPGARQFTSSRGEPVRYIDASTFEVVANGELLKVAQTSP